MSGHYTLLPATPAVPKCLFPMFSTRKLFGVYIHFPVSIVCHFCRGNEVMRPRLW